jgi:hypothetical protein
MTVEDWWNELLRPSGIIGVSGIVIGLIPSYLFYVMSQKVGRVSYAVEQVQVFDPTQLGTVRDGRQPITVLDADKKPVEGDVYAANIKIWNSGNDEIKTSNVREPFNLKLSDDARVLDCDITHATRGNAV